MAAALPPQIEAAIASGATLLTPGQRAATSLRRAWSAAQQAAGLAQWHPPVILQLETWLGTLHTALLLNGHDIRVVLTRAQQHVLWRSVIARGLQPAGDYPVLHSINAPDSLADLAARALRLLHLYGGSANAPAFAAATDTRAFQQWAQRFDRLCARVGFLTEAQLPAILLENLNAGTLSLPAQGIALIDFDTMPPAQSAFFAAMQAAGHPVQHLQSTQPAHTTELHTALDDTAELRAAAHWVRLQLEQQPAARVAVVVPELQSRRAQIDRVFAGILAPGLQAITQAAALPPYEFSLGIPLAHTAAVSAALSLLRWPAEPLPLATISALLLSPAFGAAHGPTHPQTLGAARFDAHQLRRARLLRPELSIEAMIKLLAASPQPLDLPGALRRFARTAAEAPATQPYSAWSDHFRSLLRDAGWSSSADSLSFQTLERWESVLDELATLDFHRPDPLDFHRPDPLEPGPTRAEALEALTRLTRETIFAPQSRQAPVQILGPLELGGISFDALWFLGADDLAWPLTPSPNPFIPFALQRALNMPATDAARDAAQARALTTRIAQSATRVVFSFAEASEEGSRRPSSALAHLALTAFKSFPDEPPAPARPHTLAPDDQPLPPLPDRVFPGGARVLELQAACPFRAFAELRLHSGEPASRDPGLDPRERGQLVHAIMQSFWAEATDHTQLKQLGEAGRHHLLDRSIEAALTQAQQLARSPWDAAYLEVQRLRLQQLLRPWLAFELERPYFAVAEHERTLHDTSIGPLRLQLRIDRVDATGGGPLILDYKTGPATPADWLSDRPDAPQLPLYALVAAREALGGVAFANLRAGDNLALKGFAESTAVLVKSSPMDAATLAEQVEQWQQHLTALAEAFALGDTRVDPKHYPNTCTHCHQRILCRLDPNTLTHIDDEDSPAPAGYGETPV